MNRALAALALVARLLTGSALIAAPASAYDGTTNIDGQDGVLTEGPVRHHPIAYTIENVWEERQERPPPLTSLGASTGGLGVLRQIVAEPGPLRRSRARILGLE